MAEKTIKILSWNIEHFKMNKVKEVAAIIKSYNPDVFGLYEVEAAPIYDFMLEYFPKHTLFITKGQQTQEILVACSNKFEGIKFQQKDQFRSGNPYLRPGAFLTFRYPLPSKPMYGFLFLHTDSGKTAVDFGNRNEMLLHAFNLKRKLDDSVNRETNFFIMGDLNTMGLNYPKPYDSNQIADPDEELVYIDYESQRKGKYKRSPKMRRLSKPSGTYFSTAYGTSDLDHIISSEHLRFKPKKNYGETGDFEVRLDGWRKYLNDPEKLKTITEEISDHCLLMCELIVE